VAACPSGSIRQNLFEDAQIFSEIAGVMAELDEPGVPAG
jgi:heterodisulfide reductase subunit A-like polyferredoxin